MIMLNKKLEENKFDCIVSPKNFEAVLTPAYPQSTVSFIVKLKQKQNKENVINNKNFFIAPVRFGPNYLKCKQISVSFDENLDEKNVDLNVFYDGKRKGVVEGRFRMFRKDGVPFGDVVTVRAVVE